MIGEELLNDREAMEAIQKDMEQKSEAIEDGVVDTYQKIENGVVGTYKKIENSVVGAYTKVEDSFVKKFLTHPGESVEDAKERMAEENQKRSDQKKK